MNKWRFARIWFTNFMNGRVIPARAFSFLNWFRETPATILADNILEFESYKSRHGTKPVAQFREHAEVRLMGDAPVDIETSVTWAPKTYDFPASINSIRFAATGNFPKVEFRNRDIDHIKIDHIGLELSLSNCNVRRLEITEDRLVSLNVSRSCFGTLRLGGRSVREIQATDCIIGRVPRSGVGAVDK